MNGKPSGFYAFPAFDAESFSRDQNDHFVPGGRVGPIPPLFRVDHFIKNIREELSE
jgi:hypothetical protein